MCLAVHVHAIWIGLAVGAMAHAAVPKMQPPSCLCACAAWHMPGDPVLLWFSGTWGAQEGAGGRVVAVVWPWFGGGGGWTLLLCGPFGLPEGTLC